MEGEILSDGKTVWVNGPDGCCLARFSKWGVDIHKDAAGQSDGRQCLACTHHQPTDEDWGFFRARVLFHHKIQIEDFHKPDFLGGSTYKVFDKHNRGWVVDVAPYTITATPALTSRFSGQMCREYFSNPAVYLVIPTMTIEQEFALNELIKEARASRDDEPWPAFEGDVS